MLQLDNYDV